MALNWGLTLHLGGFAVWYQAEALFNASVIFCTMWCKYIGETAQMPWALLLSLI